MHPGAGHLHPLIPLVESLQRAGHEVEVASARDYCPYIESLGMNARPAGLNWLESDASRVFPDLKNRTLQDLNMRYLTDIFSGRVAEEMCDSVQRTCEEWAPDYIVRGDFEFGSSVAAESAGVPLVTVGTGLFFSGEALRTFVGSQIAKLRSDRGLPPDPDLSRLHGDLYLSPYPESFHFPGSHFPERFHALRVPSVDAGTGEIPGELLHELGKRPTVLASLGTVFSGLGEARDIFQIMLDGLRGESINLVLTVGRAQELSSLDPGRPNTWVLSYVPHSALLPYCDAVITHGGSATTREALSLGLPVVVTPLKGEDIFHAMRCQALGVGRVVIRAGLFEHYMRRSTFQELSPETIRNAVRDVTNIPSYRQRARWLASEMNRLPGPEGAVALVEDLVRTRRSPRAALTGPSIPEVDPAILARLPHRPPFLFIERIEKVVPGVSARAFTTFRESHPAFQGHFPGAPIVPGVLLIECLAQTSALAFSVTRKPAGGRDRSPSKGQPGYLAKVDRAIFRRPVFPEERLAAEIEVERAIGRFVRVNGRITRGKEEVMSATLTLHGGGPVG